MKQILLFIVCLFGLGTMVVHAQENSEPTDLMLYQQATKAISAQEVKAEEKSIKESLHEEAVKALEQQRFVVTFHAGEWGSSRRIDLDSRRNFLMIDGQKAFFQKSVDEDFSYGHITGGIGLTPLKMLESDVVKTEKKCDKKGNITYTVMLKGKDLVGVKNAKEARITLKKGSNDVEVHVKYNAGGVSRRAGSSVYIGSLHQIDAAAIERGTLYR